VIVIVSLCAVFYPGMNTCTPQMVEEEERICAVEITLCQTYLFLKFYFKYSKLSSSQYHTLIAAAYDA
jgi:hypothetical protein